MAGVTLEVRPTLGVWLSIGYSATAGAYCELTMEQLQLWARSPTQLLMQSSFMASLQTPYIYAMKRLGSMQYGCTAAAKPTVPATEVSGMASLGTMVIKLGSDVNASFQWVLVVGPK
jgi:hypothetical protein